MKRTDAEPGVAKPLVVSVSDRRIAPFELMQSPYLIVSQTEIPVLLDRLVTQPVSVFLFISGEGIALVLIIILNTEKELNKKNSLLFLC